MWIESEVAQCFTGVSCQQCRVNSTRNITGGSLFEAAAAGDFCNHDVLRRTEPADVAKAFSNPQHSSSGPGGRASRQTTSGKSPARHVSDMWGSAGLPQLDRLVLPVDHLSYDCSDSSSVRTLYGLGHPVCCWVLHFADRGSHARRIRYDQVYDGSGSVSLASSDYLSVHGGCRNTLLGLDSNAHGIATEGRFHPDSCDRGGSGNDCVLGKYDCSVAVGGHHSSRSVRNSGTRVSCFRFAGDGVRSNSCFGRDRDRDRRRSIRTILVFE